MSDPFIGEIKLVSFDFAPRSWAFCNGQLLPINQNQALFALLGTTYGGDGRVNFALPDLRGRVPIHTAPGYSLGTRAGAESHTLLAGEVPAHTHSLSVRATTADADLKSPSNASPAVGALELYAKPGTVVSMAQLITSSVGASQPHNNLQPYLVMNWVIALTGIFPSST